MAITEQTPAEGGERTENVGRIEEIQGVVIEAVFPDKLPEINHAIRVKRPEAAKAEEDIDIAAGEEDYLVCEVQQHLGDDRVRAVALDTTDGLARGTEVIDTGAPITVPVGRGDAGADLQPARRPDRSRRPAPRRHRALADPPRGPHGRGADPDRGDVRDRHQSDRPSRAVRPRWEGGPVRWRRRWQDRDHPGADPQPRPGARRSVGVLRRRRALS